MLILRAFLFENTSILLRLASKLAILQIILANNQYFSDG